MLDRRHFLKAVTTAYAGAQLPTIARPIEGVKERAKPSQSILPIGTDYYPEDWPAERVDMDTQLMRSAGFRIVRVADTNWERMEPSEGRYDFGWLDSVVESLARNGMQSILCTSSYAPPAWMIRKHPDFYLVNDKGVRHRWGSMGFLCLNNPRYRAYVAKLVKALAVRYGQNPNVIGWQIDNEMEPARSACYDDHYCQPRFRQYLQHKFETLSNLNRQLFTQSYGHSYSAWNQIILPVDLDEQMAQVPLILESKRFFSQNIVDFVAFQARLLRQHTTGQFVTHNTYSVEMNCFELAKVLDFLSEDCYPRVGQYREPAFSADLMRGFNRGRSFQILEMRSGTAGPYTLNDATPPPGLVRLWAWQTIAHGAEGILFFRWRRNNGGSEQYWQGLLNFDGSATSALAEATTIGKELAKIGPEVTGSESPSEIAAIFSYDSLWALTIGDAKFPYAGQINCLSSAFRQWSLNVDIVDPSASLDKYKIVIAASLHVIDPTLQQRLEQFVKRGGLLILTARSGVKNQDNVATMVPPGPLEELAQISVSNYTILEDSAVNQRFGMPERSGSYHASSENTIVSVDPLWRGSYRARGWADILRLQGARALFTYQNDFYAGTPAVTLADYGNGKVIYVASFFDMEFYVDLARQTCGWAGINTGSKIPTGMDFALRRKEAKEFRFFLNFSDHPMKIDIAGTQRELISSKLATGSFQVPALDLVVLTQA